MRLLLLPILTFCSVPLWGQSTTGTILGSVADSSGLPVAGAKVSLTNEGTGITAETRSNAAGDYVFTNLPAANYGIRTRFRALTSRPIRSRPPA